MDILIKILKYIFSLFSRKEKEDAIVPPPEPPVEPKPDPEPEDNLYDEPKKGYQEFAHAMRVRESNNNYQAVNPFGYLGAYQFGLARLSDFGLTQRKPGSIGFRNEAFEWKTGFSQEQFLNDSSSQDAMFRKHVERLANHILENFENYLQTDVFGVHISLSGLVGGAHLGGIGGIQQFLTFGTFVLPQHVAPAVEDAFGTKVEDYIKLFYGYNLELA